MEKESLHRLQVILFETKEPELVKIAHQLGDEKFKKGLRKPLLDKKMENLLELLLDPASIYNIREAKSTIRKNTRKILNQRYYRFMDKITINLVF